MIALPLIIFLTWFIRSYRRLGITIGTYILFLYTLISLGAVLVDAKNLYDNHSCFKMPLGILAPLLFCILLYLCISPYSKMRRLTIALLNEKSTRLLHWIVIGYFVIFIIVLVVSFSRITEVMTSNLATIRNEQYTGENVSFYDHLSGWRRYVCAICYQLSCSAYIMPLFFMYLICFDNKRPLIVIMALLGSLTPLLISINIADRSQFAYWALNMGLCVAIFSGSFSKKAKKIVIALLLIAFSAIITYFMLVTISRFDDRDSGTVGGMILYLGESYINFCNFINYVEPNFYLCEIFPFLNDYVFHGTRYFDAARIVEAKNHYPIAVFSTFLGFIYSMSGFVVLVIYVLAYRFVSLKLVNRLRAEIVSMKNVMKVWMAALVPTLGLFGHFYQANTATIALVIWLIFAKMLKSSSCEILHYNEDITDRSIA